MKDFNQGHNCDFRGLLTNQQQITEDNNKFSGLVLCISYILTESNTKMELLLELKREYITPSISQISALGRSIFTYTSTFCETSFSVARSLVTKCSE